MTISENILQLIKDQIRAEFENLSNLAEQLVQNRYMTIPQTAKYLNLSTRTISNLLDNGTLTRINFGKSVRVDRKEVDDYAQTKGRWE